MSKIKVACIFPGHGVVYTGFRLRPYIARILIGNGFTFYSLPLPFTFLAASFHFLRSPTPFRLQTLLGLGNVVNSLRSRAQTHFDAFTSVDQKKSHESFTFSRSCTNAHDCLIIRIRIPITDY